MAAIDYKGIRNAIEELLQAETGNDGEFEGVRIYVEEEPQFGLADNEKAICVFMDRRDSAPAPQRINAGKSTTYFLQVSMWVVGFGITSFRDTCDIRDDTLAELELFMMRNRTLDGKCATLWLEGGALISARSADGQVFTAAAELIVTLEVTASNV